MLILKKILVGLLFAALILLIYKIGVYIDSFMTPKTEFYFTFHHYAQIMASAIGGVFMAITYGE